MAGTWWSESGSEWRTIVREVELGELDEVPDAVLDARDVVVRQR